MHANLLVGVVFLALKREYIRTRENFAIRYTYVLFYV